MKEIVDGFLALDLSDLLALFDQVIKNPGSNPQASLLVLGGVVVLTLLAVVIAILVITSRDDDEDEDGTIEAGPRPEAIVERTVTVERPPREPLTPEERRWLATRSFLLGALGLSLIWLLTGITTGSEAMCLSCHGSDMPHSERLVEEGSDPHASTSCVRCHGSGGVFGSLTYDVPGRAIHFAEGIIAPKAASGFGKPIASSACSSCHRRMGDGIVTVERRGVRVKHKEPLDAGATCVGCHEIQRQTGAVGSWTVGMSACLRCHDNVQASSECSDCHVKDVAQALHVNREPSPRRLVPETKCYTCHDERACDSCHGIRMPHSAGFINSEHPRAATLDTWYKGGKTCKKCHTARRNPCDKCHDKGPFPGHPTSAWPRVHGARPAAGFDSCDSCHGSMAKVRGRNFCGVCHERYKSFQR